MILLLGLAVNFYDLFSMISWFIFTYFANLYFKYLGIVWINCLIT
jgi:hypothetical protein